MTASPAPGSEEYARSAYCLPSEEEALVAYNAVWEGAPGIDAHNVDIVRREAMAAVFALIRPAFEAKEREIERLRAENIQLALELRDRRLLSDGHRQSAEEHLRDRLNAEARALSAEAKLAQAVEALGRAKDEIVRTADDLSMNSPAVKLVEDIAAIIGQPALNSRAIVKDALDRARAASNIGQNEGEKG